MIHLVTFATNDMSEAVSLCQRSALIKGGFDECHLSNTWDVHSLAETHPDLFAQGRGYGFWSWKPYLIERLVGPAGFVRNVNDGDIVVYSDAGIEFLNNVRYIIDRMDQDIFLFGNNWEHAHWCKRDIVEAVYPYEVFEIGSWARFGKQVQASVIFFRVSDYTRKFVKEWLDWCLFEGGRLIDDSPSRIPNHPEFRENRHDQAILTTMAYREGLRLHYWPASYNGGAFVYEKKPEYADDDYPILFNHHGKRGNCVDPLCFDRYCERPDHVREAA